MRRPGGIWERTWWDPIYDVRIYLLCSDERFAVRWFQRQLACDVSGSVWGRGKAVWVDNERYTALVVWLPVTWTAGTDGLGTLSHECHHGAHHVLTNRGLVHSDDSEEAFAYYASWLFRSVLGRLRNK